MFFILSSIFWSKCK